MSNIRALLKAKRQEARVTHPLASYSSSGQLRCIACSTTIKQASVWDGHVASKAHRVNVMKMKEEQTCETSQPGEAEHVLSGTPKRKAVEEEEEETIVTHDKTLKKQRLEESTASEKSQLNSGFPTNFFSDPSRAPPTTSDDSDNEQDLPPVITTTAAPAVTTNNDPLDLEWAQFQQAMLSTSQMQNGSQREAYEMATVVAEPQINDTMEGLPSQYQKPEDASTQQPPDEEQLWKLKEQEERELIMDRLLEEERAQEEADAKVTLLKSKLDAMKRKRQAAKAAKKVKTL